MASGNPYAPPQSDDEAPASDPGGAFEHADRQARFFGTVIDFFFSLIVIAVTSFALRVLLLVIFGPSLSAFGLLRRASLFAPLVLMAVLIAQRGQTVGKMVMRTRIVDANGRTAG